MSKILALILLIAASPIMCLLAVWVFLNDGTPIFYKSIRMGQNFQPFSLLKFRTMRLVSDRAIDDLSGMFFGGALIRALALDEIPNLVAVLKGEMVFFGPRAMPFVYKEYIQKKFHKRQDVKPGLIGLAQGKCDYCTDLSIRFKYDLFQMKKLSSYRFRLFVLILTIQSLISKRFFWGDKAITLSKKNAAKEG